MEAANRFHIPTINYLQISSRQAYEFSSFEAMTCCDYVQPAHRAHLERVHKETLTGSWQLVVGLNSYETSSYRTTTSRLRQLVSQLR